MIFTADDLISEWKMRRLLEPQRLDASLRRRDAIDLDAYVARCVDRWYRDLLSTAPASLLVLHDIAPRLVPAGFPRGGGRSYALPDDCLRLVEIEVSPSSPPALIAEAGSPLALRQGCPFSCGGPAQPVAVVASGRFTLYGLPAGAEAPSRVLAVLSTPEGIYELQPQALDTMNQF